MVFNNKAMNTQLTERSRSRIKAVLAELTRRSLAVLFTESTPMYDHVDKRARCVSQRTHNRLTKVLRTPHSAVRGR